MSSQTLSRLGPLLLSSVGAPVSSAWGSPAGTICPRLSVPLDPRAHPKPSGCEFVFRPAVAGANGILLEIRAYTDLIASQQGRAAAGPSVEHRPITHAPISVRFRLILAFCRERVSLLSSATCSAIVGRSLGSPSLDRLIAFRLFVSILNYFNLLLLSRRTITRQLYRAIYRGLTPPSIVGTVPHNLATSCALVIVLPRSSGRQPLTPTWQTVTSRLPMDQ